MLDKKGFLRRADRCKKFAAGCRNRTEAIQWIALARHYARLADVSELENLENIVERRIRYQRHLTHGRLVGDWMRA